MLVKPSVENDLSALQQFMSHKVENCDVIALVSAEHAAQVIHATPELTDTWPDTMSKEELLWRFNHWQ